MVNKCLILLSYDVRDYPCSFYICNHQLLTLLGYDTATVFATV